MTDLDKQIEKLQKEYVALGWKLHQLKRQKASEDRDYEHKHAKELGFADVEAYHHYTRGVDLGYWDWHGNINPQKHGNLAPICRKEPAWSKVVPGFLRNAYLMLFFDQWTTVVAHDHLFTAHHYDYRNFLENGYGPLTDKELEFIKSGKGGHSDGLTFG